MLIRDRRASGNFWYRGVVAEAVEQLDGFVLDPLEQVERHEGKVPGATGRIEHAKCVRRS